MTEYSEKMEEILATHLPEFYNNAFIQEMINGDVNAEALLNYVSQDQSYLGYFLPIFGETLEAFGIDSKELEAFQEDGDTEPHEMLLNLVEEASGRPEEVKEVDLLPGTKQYLNLLKTSREASPFISMSALAACPYVYAYLAEQSIAAGKMTPTNPFYEWFDFYQRTDGGITVHLLQALDEKAKKMSEEEQAAGLEAFLQAVKCEDLFFAQAM
ncbi:hypothetical protein G6R29_00525 [Fructobacillus sp. M2-14]|uniref:Aminopyrimidine aminohydrolase n=1 Tax=Fructobacillus broussonetiae TaxID=2713173 RepID=A0ABS5QYR6_9LACO|nr:hypothetical protein [Fructobacillus broussonetiae]MBS9338122.1 hypothetical protein [Fructobacillus broussonetiae]